MKWTEEFYLFTIMLLYSITSGIFIPISQSFLYHQICLWQYSPEYCIRDPASSGDSNLHFATNKVMLIGTIFMCGVALFAAPRVALYSDNVSRTRALYVPFLGIIVSDIIFIITAGCPPWMAPFGFILGETIFGLTGGYMALLSSAFTYLSCIAKFKDPKARSTAIARLEGIIGLGGIIGNLLGAFGRIVPYVLTFLFFGVLHGVCLLLITMLPNHRDTADAFNAIPLQENESNRKRESIEDRRVSIGMDLQQVGPDKDGEYESNECACLDDLPRNPEETAVRVLKPAKRRRIYYVAFAASFFTMIGSSQILFLYFKHKFHWDAGNYSIFTGLARIGSTATAFFLYPYLRNVLGKTDRQLAIGGLVARMIAKGCIALFPYPWIYMAVIFEAFGRFPATALRSLISSQTEIENQGQAFGKIASVEAWCHLGAGLFFHTIYPASLEDSCPEIVFIAMVVVLIPPTALVAFYKD